MVQKNREDPRIIILSKRVAPKKLVKRAEKAKDANIIIRAVASQMIRFNFG